VLVLGGIGFIGRNLVAYLVENNIAEKIRAADKVLPSTAFLGGSHAAAFENPIVEYKQCSLTSDAGLKKAFELEDGSKFDWVINCAAETKYGQTEEVYKEKVLDLSVKIGKYAASVGVEKFVELSTAQVYEHGKKASDESSKIKPWTNIAKYKHDAETELKKIPGLNLIILRPAIVYGPGDLSGIMPRLLVGAVYVHLNEKMKLLWSGDLRINTVHVKDVSRAIVHVCQNGKKGDVYNLADTFDTNQDKINKFLEDIFNIKTGFLGSALSSVASVSLKGTTETVNEKHLKPWSDLLKAEGLTNTPLTPYLDMELLDNHALSIDGSAITKTGFKYDHPEVTLQLLKEELDYFIAQGLFPKSVLPKK